MATCDELATQLSGLQNQLVKLQKEQDNPEQACAGQGLTGDACTLYLKSLGGRIASVKTEITGVQQQQIDRGCVSPQPFMFCKTGDTWTNWAGNITITPFHHCFTNNVDGLVAIVREAESAGRHVRASGSHWSFSDVSITQDYLIETQKLNRTLTNVIPEALTAAARSRILYHVEAGITLQELYHRLGTDRGWALPTLGGSGGQTLAGAISTATHGADFNLPPLADMVQAIHLVGPGGTQYWIERSAAITDPKMLSARLPDIHPDNIHYDDKWFYSVLVSMGCMGIFYSLVIEVRAQFGLSELRAQSSWNVVRPLLEDGTLFTHLPPWVHSTRAAGTSFTPRFLEIVINPYKNDQGDYTCMVTFREEIALPNPPTGRPGKNLFNFLCEHSNADVLVGPLIVAVGPLVAANPLLAWLPIALTALLALHVTVSELIAKVVDIASQARLSWLVRDLTNTVLTSGRPAETDRTDVSYAIMDTYDYSAPPVNCYKVLSLEMALDATNNQYLNFIDEMFRIVDDAVNQGVYIAGLLAIRFSGHSNAYLAMQQYERTCTIEVSPLTDASSSVDLLRRFEDAMVPYGGRAHWGQFQQRCYADTYPNFPQWQAIHAALTNNGTLHTFDNDFSVRCSLGTTVGGDSGSLWHTAQDAPNGGFGGWSRLFGAAGLGRIAVDSNADGRLEVFAVDTAAGLAWHTAQDAPNGGFGSWSRLFDAAGLGEITVGRNADGRLEVFAVDTADHLVWHTAQTAPNGGFGGWSWLRDAKGLGQIAVGRNADGRLEVFAVDTAAGLAWHTAQDAPNGGFGGWSRLFDAAGLGRIAVGSNADGRLEVFAVDTAAGLAWHTAQDAPNGGFGSWSRLFDAAGLGQIAVGSNADGRLEVFAVDTAAGLAWHTAQDAPNGTFGGWSRIFDAAGLGQIAVSSNAAGQLEVFALDAREGSAWHVAQNAPNGTFGSWQIMGDARGLSRIAVARNADGRLEVFSALR